MLLAAAMGLREELLEAATHDVVSPLFGLAGQDIHPRGDGLYLGDVGSAGTAADVANLIYHATGRRVRETPITLDKQL